MSGKEVLRKHFHLYSDVPPTQMPPDDNVAHYWLVPNEKPMIANIIVLSREEYFALKEIL